MNDEAPATIRPVPRGGPEWHALVRAQEAAQIGLYSRKEVRAMMAGQFESSWMPPGHFSLIEALGVDVGGELVGWTHVWGRDDDTAVVESLFIKPPHRCKGYARRLIREAIEVARRADYPMIEIHALETEPDAVSTWEHLLQIPSNQPGHVELLGRRRPSKGWRLPTASISV